VCRADCGIGIPVGSTLICSRLFLHLHRFAGQLDCQATECLSEPSNGLYVYCMGPAVCFQMKESVPTGQGNVAAVTQVNIPGLSSRDRLPGAGRWDDSDTIINTAEVPRPIQKDSQPIEAESGATVVSLQCSQCLHHLFGTDYGALPGEDLLHQQLVDFRVPVGASVFHYHQVIVQVRC